MLKKMMLKKKVSAKQVMISILDSGIAPDPWIVWVSKISRI